MKTYSFAGFLEPDMGALKLQVSKAKLNLMMRKKSTFFSALLSNIEIIVTKEVPYARTNGLWMKLNPYFLSMQGVEKTIGLMMHELYHIVFEHIERCNDFGYNPKLFNIAGDHYNNLALLSQGFQIPDGGYHDPKYTKWSTTEIYFDLLKNPPPMGDDDFIMDIDPDVPPGMSDQEYRETVVSNIIKAVNQAQINKDVGSIPANVLQRLEDVINPKLPWQVILQNYTDTYRKEEYSMSRPNRRFQPEFYLPTQRSESIGQVTAGLDVSGSMSGKDLSTCMCEVSYLWQVLKPDTLRLMSFDIYVHLNKLFSQGDNLDEVELVGGGGTNVNPLLDSVRQENPTFCLIFTDGYFPTPDMSGIDSDIFWIIKGNPKFSAPMGHIIHFN